MAVPSVIFHPFAQKPPSTDLHQIGVAVGAADVITFTKFFGVRSRGVYSVGVENCHLPLTKPVAVNTGLAVPRSPRYSKCVQTMISFVMSWYNYKPIHDFLCYICWHCLHCMRSRVYETVQCPSVRLSVSPIRRL